MFSYQKLVIRVEIHKMIARIYVANRSSLIWVCTVCLGLFGRQLANKEDPDQKRSVLCLSCVSVILEGN